MTSNLEIASRIKHFENLIAFLSKRQKVEYLCDHAYLLRPQEQAAAAVKNKKIPLTLMALTHGDEVYGLEVLNKVLECFALQVLQPKISVALILGNVAATRAHERFLEQDLNRSFSATNSQNLEGRRAQSLSKILAETGYLVDFHQTREPTMSPFFIFPYTRENLDFAKILENTLPIVTHWGKGFSSGGMCTDEFVISRKGTALTLEAGQKGMDPYQVGLGFKIALNAIAHVSKQTLEISLPQRNSEITSSQLYKIDHSQTYEDHRGLTLDPGWKNFHQVKKGERLGMQKQKIHEAPRTGKILFPKYSGFQRSHSHTVEMYQIIRSIDEKELPKT